ncbi:MAG: glycosyltransferase family 2 protein [Bacteroidia bacterium]
MTERNEEELVSVICVCWNHEEYIEQCLKSILDQTFKNIEIIFIDNNSTDQSFEIASKILKNSTIPYSLNKRNSNFGIANNLNFAVNLCKGKYVTSISTDDWLTNDSITKKVNYLEENTEFAMVSSDGYIYNQSRNETIPYIEKRAKTGYLFKDLLKDNFIFAIGVLIKLSVIKEVGLYDEECPIEDWSMWLKISKNHQIGFIPEKLAYYRKHGNNFSGNFKKMKQVELDLLNKYKEYPETVIGKKNVRYRFYHYTILGALSKLPFYYSTKNMFWNLHSKLS